MYCWHCNKYKYKHLITKFRKYQSALRKVDVTSASFLLNLRKKLAEGGGVLINIKFGLHMKEITIEKTMSNLYLVHLHVRCWPSKYCHCISIGSCIQMQLVGSYCPYQSLQITSISLNKEFLYNKRKKGFMWISSVRYLTYSHVIMNFKNENDLDLKSASNSVYMWKINGEDMDCHEMDRTWSDI